MSLESFRTIRWLRTLNLVAQAILFLTFFLGLNYVARNHVWRFDLTKHRSFSLSPETLSYLKNLNRPVKIYATFSNDSDFPEVRGLLAEYKNATEANPVGQRVSVEYLDIYQDRRRAEELGIEQPDLLVLVSGENRRMRPVHELYVSRNVEGKIEHTAFQGEQALTAAILDVSHAKRTKIYFLSGHGELQPNGADAVDANHGLSLVHEGLRQRNFDVESVELATTRKIPDDAELLIAVAPRGRYSGPEQQLLRQYLSVNAGRLILFLQPGLSAAELGLDDLLLDWGVLVDNDVIFDIGQKNISDDNDLIIRSFDPKHPVVQSLINYDLALHVGRTRSVRPDPSLATSGGLSAVAIAHASPTAWGEVGVELIRRPKFDHPGNIHPIRGFEPADRLGIVVASERVGVRDNLPFSVRRGRLVVFGSSDLITNSRIVNIGNQSIFLNAVNWAVDSDTKLAIPARPIERFQLSLSSAELRNLRYTLLLALPGAAALLGLMVYWARRS